MNRAEYNRRRRDIARREYNLRVQQGRINQYSQPFDSWFTGSFLTDALLIGLVINELGDENQVVEETPVEDTTDNSSYEDSSSDSSYEDSSSDSSYDSGSDSFDSGGDFGGSDY